ncbi:hypothetical protein ACTHRK_17295 [Dietzia cercidiphylli]|jgi:hypothetical protein|uniref:hypothetical protein n=1 Tax=Dietzia cercidiphylli TaxID=498199 RepID=UPI003F80DE07
MSTNQRRSLAADFGAKRGAGLGDRLPKIDRSTTDTAEPASTAAVPTESAAAETAAETEKATPPRPRRGRGRPRTRTRNATVYLEDEVADALTDHSRQQRRTYAAITVQAFNTVAGIERLFEPSYTPDTGGMPEAPRAIGRAGGPTTMINLRLTDEQLAWLENEVDRVGAPSRSALVNAVLRRFLTT